MNKIMLNDLNIKKTKDVSNYKLLLTKSLVGITLASSLLLSGCSPQSDKNDLFRGLTPKLYYQDYAIYDLVEQRGLACAEALEIIGNDHTYDYYLSCWKSEQIYFVNEDEVIKIKHAYLAGIITLQELYDLGIVGRMPIIRTLNDNQKILIK